MNESIVATTTITTNTVEGYYSIFKRGMKGVYQHCSEKHLHRYLAEFDFRYSIQAGDELASTPVIAAVYTFTSDEVIIHGVKIFDNPGEEDEAD
jgi:hypothetical protein